MLVDLWHTIAPKSRRSFRDKICKYKFTLLIEDRWGGKECAKRENWGARKNEKMQVRLDRVSKRMGS